MFGTRYGDKSRIPRGRTEERLAVPEGNLGIGRAVDAVFVVGGQHHLFIDLVQMDSEDTSLFVVDPNGNLL